jgi:hypothetical protein
MYSELDKHCRECICVSCDLRGTDDCLEGADGCDKCDNTCHTGHCWWHPDEREGGNV